MSQPHSRALQCILLTPIFATLLAGCSVPYKFISPPPPLFEESAINSGANSTAPSLPKSLDTTNLGAHSENSANTTADNFMYRKFISTLQEALKPTVNRDQYQSLYVEGTGLIDYRCAQYFAHLGKAQQDLGFTRKETNLTGGLVSGMLGLANQSPKVIANSGALFGFTSASMDSYQDAYMFSPDVGAIQKLVESKTEKFKSEHSSIATTWAEATSRLSQYEAFCQPQGIRHMINESVTNSAASGVPVR